MRIVPVGRDNDELLDTMIGELSFDVEAVKTKEAKKEPFAADESFTGFTEDDDELEITFEVDIDEEEGDEEELDSEGPEVEVDLQTLAASAVKEAEEPEAALVAEEPPQDIEAEVPVELEDELEDEIELETGGPSAEVVAEAAEEAPALDDDEAAFAWLESLAVQQGADEALLLSPEERKEAPPEWVQEVSEEALPTFLKVSSFTVKSYDNRVVFFGLP